MPEGTITTYRPNGDDDHGFAVIAPDDGGPPLFLYSNSMEGLLATLRRRLRAFRETDSESGKPFDRLRRGQRVTFTRGQDLRQPGRARAENVRVIER